MAEKKESKKAGEEAAPKNKMPMMAILAVVVVAALIGTFIIGKQVSAKSKPGLKPVEHGPVLPLDEFLVNLADPSGDHFLKVTINLELDKDKGKTPDSLKDQVPIIRDAILMSLSSKMRDDIGPPAGREKLKSDIKKSVNTALGENDIQDVYFTNFVTQ